MESLQGDELVAVLANGQVCIAATGSDKPARIRRGRSEVRLDNLTSGIEIESGFYCTFVTLKFAGGAGLLFPLSVAWKLLNPYCVLSLRTPPSLNIPMPGAPPV